MLYIVLVLVLGALALVITALVTANSLWAWLSIGASGVAGLLLIVEWWRRRSANGTHAADGSDPGASEPSDRDESESSDAETEQDEKGPDETVSEQEDADRPTMLLPVSGRLSDSDEEPPEEPTDAADLLVVSDLDVEVQVVDERPRYHLGECTWIEAHDTIPVPVREARELGFTPCAWCGPDARLAAQHRSQRTVRK